MIGTDWKFFNIEMYIGYVLTEREVWTGVFLACGRVTMYRLDTL